MTSVSSSVVQWPLVGRDAELQVLCDAIDDPGIDLVLVSGPAGVGKTRLVDSAFSHAVDDGREHGQEEVLRQSPGRGLGQAQGRVGQVGPRRRDRVTQQQITGRQQRRGDSERQPQRVERRQGFRASEATGDVRTKSDQIRSGGRSVGRWVGSFSVMASAAGIGPESVSRRPKKPCPAASRPGSISAACDRRL